LMIVTGTLGLEMHNEPCRKCGGRMFLRPCPCFARKKGWRTCARCIRCGHLEYVRRK